MIYILDTNVVISKKSIENFIVKNLEIRIPNNIEKIFAKHPNIYITEMIYSEIYAQIWGPYSKYVDSLKELGNKFLTTEQVEEQKKRIANLSLNSLNLLKAKIYDTKFDVFSNMVRKYPHKIQNDVNLKSIKDFAISLEIKRVHEIHNINKEGEEIDEIVFVTNNIKHFKTLQKEHDVITYDKFKENIKDIEKEKNKQCKRNFEEFEESEKKLKEYIYENLISEFDKTDSNILNDMYDEIEFYPSEERFISIEYNAYSHSNQIIISYSYEENQEEMELLKSFIDDIIETRKEYIHSKKEGWE